MVSAAKGWQRHNRSLAGYRFLVKSPVAVEKLLLAKFAKIKLRQEAPQSIFSDRVDIFYPPNFGCLRRKGSFSTPTPVCDNYFKLARTRESKRKVRAEPIDELALPSIGLK
jgi:hypothetical protein